MFIFHSISHTKLSREDKCFGRMFKNEILLQDMTYVLVVKGAGVKHTQLHSIVGPFAFSEFVKQHMEEFTTKFTRSQMIITITGFPAVKCRLMTALNLVTFDVNLRNQNAASANQSCSTLDTFKFDFDQINNYYICSF